MEEYSESTSRTLKLKPKVTSLNPKTTCDVDIQKVPLGGSHNPRLSVCLSVLSLHGGKPHRDDDFDDQKKLKKRSPLVLVGAGVAAAVLFAGLAAFRDGDVTSQRRGD